jgi:hypothetical protein
MGYRHYLDNPRVREICKEDSNFREHLEAAWGKPPLPEGYRYNALAVQADGCTIRWHTHEKDYRMDIELDDDDWTTVEIFLDKELVYARVNGDPEPIINRAPKVYFPNF